MRQYVAFSGGYDSTALALLFPEATPVFTDTGDEYPHVYEHLNRFERITGRAVIRIQSKHGTLPGYIKEQKFMPNHGARFCTRLFKIEPFNDWLRANAGDDFEFMVGLRADEPDRVGNEDMSFNIRYPLREMGYTRMDVIKTVIEAGLFERPKPYAARGGCIGCFYKRASEIRAMIDLIPDVVETLITREEAVQDERGAYFYMFPNIGKSIRQFRDEYLAQGKMFSVDDLYRDAGDTSDVGAACGLFCNR